MKIAVWNVERLKHKSKLNEILSACSKANPDILVLTETDERVRPQYKYGFHTPKAREILPELYRDTENRVSIFTNYKCIRQYDTYDRYSSICVELETEIGKLTVYGTIIGVYGNRHSSYSLDLENQLSDFGKLTKTSGNLCVCGDLNCSLGDNYYFTEQGRTALLKAFEANNMEVLTQNTPECIDHIAVSKKIIKNSSFFVEEWNLDKSLSDHKGIAVTVTSAKNI